jgi:hypothetical protein
MTSWCKLIETNQFSQWVAEKRKEKIWGLKVTAAAFYTFPLTRIIMF